MAPPEMPRSVSSTSLADRLAALNARSSSSTKTPSPPSSVVPGAGSRLKDRIGKFNDAGSKPLVPKSSFGLGVAPEGPTIGRGLYGNRIPSASREGLGVTSQHPRSVSTSSTSGRSTPNPEPSLQPQHTTGPLRTTPAASLSAAGPPTVTTSSTGSRRSSSNGSIHALDSSVDAASSSLSTSISSAFVQTTNALPPSMLSATHPDVSSLATSRPSSILAHGSSTSVASLTSIASSSIGSNPSVASSYDIEPQQPPYTEVQAAEDDVGDSASIRSTISRTSSTRHLGVPRASSPVGSLVVEPASAAPSEFGGSEAGTSDVIHTPSSPALSMFVETGSIASFSALPEQQEAPLTPRATEERHLDLPSIDDLSLANNAPLETPTEPVADDPLAAMRANPDLEPDVESAEAVPALQDEERGRLEERVNETSLPLEEIGGEAEVDVKVENWQEGVVPSMLPEVESGGEVDVERKVESWVDRLREADTSGGREGSVASASDAGRDCDGDEAGEEAKGEKDVDNSAPPHQDDHPQPHSAEPAAIDHLISDLDKAESSPQDFEGDANFHPFSASPSRDPRPKSIQTDSTPRKESASTVPLASTPPASGPATGSADEELKSPIPGAFPDTPTHSGFVHVSPPSSARPSPPRQPVFQPSSTSASTPSSPPTSLISHDSFPKDPSAPSSSSSPSPADPSTLPPMTPSSAIPQSLLLERDSIPFPHRPTPPHPAPSSITAAASSSSELKRSPSRLKNPHEIDSDDESGNRTWEGSPGVARVLSRESRRYS